MDERHALELLHAAAERGEAKQIGHDVDGHRLVAHRLEQAAQPLLVLVAEGQDDLVDGVAVQNRAQVGIASEPGHAADVFPLVAHQTEDLDADVGARADASHDARR